jgi:hypothetical protein
MGSEGMPAMRIMITEQLNWYVIVGKYSLRFINMFAIVGESTSGDVIGYVYSSYGRWEGG